MSVNDYLHDFITEKNQYMASKDRPHLRDEAGSLLIAFELGGAEELTVASGGTAIAALVCRQSHKSPETNSSSRSIVSCKHCLTQISVGGDRSLSLSVTLEFTRAACDFATRAEPRKRRRCAPPSTHTCHHRLTTRAHIFSRTTHTSLPYH